MEIFKNYAYFVDEIRRQKGMTIRKLCEEIVNERTYRRYLTGELQLSQNKIILFCDKLGISLNDFYQNFIEKDKFEFGTLYELYVMIHSKDYESFKQLIDKYDNSYFVNNLNKRFYMYLNNRYLYETKKITIYYAYDKYSRIIDFPNNIENRVFDFSDILVLVGLSTLERKMQADKYTASLLLKRILLNEDIRYLSSNGKNILPSIYSTTSMAFGNRGDYDSCESLASEGIRQCKKLGSNNALTNLYFSRSLAKYHTGRKEESYIDAVKCLSNLIAKDLEKAYKKYYNTFFNLFGIDPETLFKIVFEKNRV